MGLAIKHIPHYTYDDYCQWEGRWELIDGIPYAMSPSPVYKHQSVILKIATQLQKELAKYKNCRAIISPFDWKIKEDTIVQPDVMVACGTINEKHLTFPPSVIFEVLSPGTEQKDKTVKYEIYEAQGVKYFIIINPQNKNAEIFELKNKSFSKIKNAKNEKTVFDISSCKINFNFSIIW